MHVTVRFPEDGFLRKRRFFPPMQFSCLSFNRHDYNAFPDAFCLTLKAVTIEIDVKNHFCTSARVFASGKF